MSLFKLCRMGLLVEESQTVLNSLKNEMNWINAEESLIENGLSPSKARSYELKNEIRRRFTDNEDYGLPDLNELMSLTKMKLKNSVKKEIFYTYLYYNDSDFSHMVDLLRDIDNHLKNKQIISRNEIKTLFLNYQKSKNVIPKDKTVQNWIGRFISILSDVRILMKKGFNVYVINFGAIQPETWIFFTISEYFKSKEIIRSPIFNAFNLNMNHLPFIIDNINTKKIKYKMIEDEKDNITIKLETDYLNLEQWINESK